MMKKTLRSVALAVLASLILAGCSPTAPSGPPSIAGAWIGEVNGVRVRLSVTERPDSEVPNRWLLSGDGTLTSLADGESVVFEVVGDNSLAPPVSVKMSFSARSVFTTTYGDFKGGIQGSALVGEVRNDSRYSIGPFFGPPVAAVFTRP